MTEPPKPWGWMGSTKSDRLHCFYFVESAGDGFQTVRSLCGRLTFKVSGPWQWQGWPSCNEDCLRCRRLFMVGSRGLRALLEADEADTTPAVADPPRTGLRWF